MKSGIRSNTAAKHKDKLMVIKSIEFSLAVSMNIKFDSYATEYK